MAREIKFRVWEKYDDGEGRMLYPADMYGIWPNKQGVFDGIHVAEGDQYVVICGEDGSVLMQYTGLKDKNGQDIYEGDILQCSEDGYYEAAIVVVEWNNDNFPRIMGWNLMRDGEALNYYYGVSPDDTWAIIGNIHETPELLEEQT